MNLLLVFASGLCFPVAIMFASLYFMENDVLKFLKKIPLNSLVAAKHRMELLESSRLFAQARRNDAFLSMVFFAISSSCAICAISRGATFSFITIIPGFFFGSPWAMSCKRVFLENMKPCYDAVVSIQNTMINIKK